MAIRRKHIRSVAETLLETRGITDAPVPVDRIAESLGIEVRRETVDEDLSGFLFRDLEQGTAIIGVNAGLKENRVRFTIAHELGHFLLHEGETVHFDGKRPGLTLNLRGIEASKGSDDNEREANLFAAELLMPVKFLERALLNDSSDLMDENTLQDLAKKYQVSVQALTFRLTYLNYIDL